jgi:hypothetical protein
MTEDQADADTGADRGQTVDQRAKILDMNGGCASR